TDAPMTDEPMTDAPMTDEPTTDVPMTDEPMTDVPMTDAPVTEEPDDTGELIPPAQTGDGFGTFLAVALLVLVGGSAAALLKKE
ncbi:MAG: peptidase, partial [Clostridia bacterium]|nr:peptidase [Clostridia bacterium]